MEAIIASEVLHWDLLIKCRKRLNVTKFTSLCAMAHKMALTGKFRVYRKRSRASSTSAASSMVATTSLVRPPRMRP
jgi:hypothetical protein